MMLARRAPVRPLSEQVADAIVQSIAEGSLQPGQRLVETELAARFMTSRVPVREAVKALEAQGIVVSAPHRGTYVGSFDAAQQAQVRAVRVTLERQIAPLAAARLRAQPHLAATLHDVVARMDGCRLGEDRWGMNRADVAFHRALCHLAGEAILTTLWSAIAHHVVIAFGLEIGRYPDAQAVVTQHRALLRALLEAPLATVPVLVERHIKGLDLTPASSPTPN